MIHPVTTIPLSSKHRVSQLLFHSHLQYLAVQSHDRSVEIFRVRTEEEIHKKRARRKKRAREKKKEKGQKELDTGDEENEEGREIDLVELFTPYIIVRSNGKIRSFDFGSETAINSKGNTQVCLRILSPAPPHSSRSSLRFPRTLWRSIVSHHLHVQKKTPQKPRSSIPLIYLGTERTSEPFH